MRRKLSRLLLGWAEGFWGGKERYSELRRLVTLLVNYRTHLILAVLCMVGYNLFTAAPAWYAKDVVDALQAGHTPTIGRFVLVGFGIVLIFGAKGFFYFGQNYLMGIAGQRLITDLRTQLYQHLQSLPFAFFTGKPSGDLVTRFTSDLLNLQNTIKLGVTGPLRDIPQIGIFLAILVFRSWELFLVTFLLIPIVLLLISRFGRRNNELTSQRLESFGDMTSLLMETINGFRVVKAFNMERYEEARFDKANRQLLKKNLRTIRIASYSTPILETIGACAGAGIIMFGGWLIILGKITPGDFVSFLLAFFMLNDPIKKLNDFNMKVQEGLAAAKRIFELLDIPAEITDKPGAIALPPFTREIAIDVERFSYAGSGAAVLRDVSVRVPAGRVVALVGTSGSGKTTLVNLIPRFFELQQGSVRIDGHDIRDVTLASLRGQIAIVTQEIFLFNDTVANNIAYGSVDCPMEKIVAAAKAAKAHDFIMAMSQGYDTSIGEDGMHLSGGQRQRLAIARALIKDAPILILD
ncbi:MAG: ABC transporter ATP-binding protein, partial [Candidatus Lambdaproteobacteria bacterium]|nr:ABC transporter ATP-binding protein [Candidatus Lambdaproteobacteria bacterium]